MSLRDLRAKTKERHGPDEKPAGRRWYFYALFVVAAMLLVAAGGAAYYYERPPGDATPRELMAIGEAFVRDSIQDGMKANFSDENETQVQPLPEKKFLVTGWVDVISAEGVVERQTFSCVIYKNEANYWAGEKVALIPLTM